MRLELANFRVHQHFVFTPAQEGVTALKGNNGNGKSTVVDAMAWALFGTKPAGVSKTSDLYREGGNFKKEKCYVRVDLDVGDSHPLRIERRMVSKGGQVACDVYEVADEVQHLAGSSVSHSESFIRKKLKMDERGFLSAVMVQQKQVDYLVSAGDARKRREIIEKLTGIYGLTTSLDLARKEYNELNKAVSLSTVNNETLEELQTAYDQASRHLVDQEASKEKAEANRTQYAAYVQSLKDKESTMRQHVGRVNEIDSKLSVLQPGLKSTHDEMESSKDRKQDLKRRLGESQGLDSYQSVVQERTEQKEQLARVVEQGNQVRQALNDSMQQQQTDQHTIDQSSYHSNNVDEKLSDTQTAIVNTQQQIDTQERQCIRLESDVHQLNESIELIQHGEEGTCPTCLQEVQDTDATLTDLRGHSDSKSTDLQAEQANIQANKDHLEQLRREETTLHELSAAVARNTEAIDYDKTLQHKLSKIEYQEKELTDKVDSIEKTYYNLERVQDLSREYEDAKKRFSRATQRYQEQQTEIDTLKEERRALPDVDEDALEYHQDKLKKAQQKLETLTESYQEKSNNVNVLHERLRSLSERLDEEQKNMERYQSLLSQLEVASSAVSVISEFRQHRIDYAVPAIASLASDLLNRFTDGAFVKLSIDSEFHIAVTTARGNTRPIGLLSGGELSLAAIALRIAISVMLNANLSNNLLVLDEAFVSQDDTRMELILNAIKSVCKGQIVLVAHNNSVDSIVDESVEL